MKSFSNETRNFFLQKVLFLLHFGSCQNCMNSANLVAEYHQKLCNGRVMSTEEPNTCEYVTLLQSFHRGTLSIRWYIAQNVQPTFSMSVLFRRLFRTAIFSRFSKVAIPTSIFMNEFYNCGFLCLVFQCSKKSLRQFEIMYQKQGNKKQNQRKNMYQCILNVLLRNDRSKVTYSQVHGSPVFKTFLLQSFQ